MDLFVILVSLSLAARFNQVTERMRQFAKLKVYKATLLKTIKALVFLILDKRSKNVDDNKRRLRSLKQSLQDSG